MSDTLYRPIQNGFETTIIQDLSSNPADLIIYCAAVPTATIPVGKFISVVLSPKTSNQEIVKVQSIDTVNKTMTIAGGGRGLNLGNALPGTVNEHTVGASVIISDDYILFTDYGDAIDSKTNVSGDAMTGPLTFSGTTNPGITVSNLTTVQRLALVPLNGTIVYDTTAGLLYQYITGAWSTIDAGLPTPNASTAVAGKVQIATQAENNAGTVVGTTGALLSATPNLTAKSVQNSSWVYAASATGNDAYVIALSPVIVSYSDGQKFSFKVDVPNTGPATLNAGPGAKALVIGTTTPLSTGYFVAGGIYDVTYSLANDNFQVQVPVSGFFTAKGDIITATAANVPFTLPVGADGFAVTADSTAPSGLSYSFPDASQGWNLLNNGAYLGDAATTLWPQSNVGTGVQLWGGINVSMSTGASPGDYETAFRYLVGTTLAARANGFTFADLPAGKKFVFETTYFDQAGAPTNTEFRMGFGTNNSQANSDTNAVAQAKFKIIDSQASTVVGDGSGALTTTNFTLNNLNYYHILRIVFTQGVSVQFYVDGVLVDTRTANIPLIADTGSIICFLGLKTNTNVSKTIGTSACPYIAIQK